jgi:hypothetical protein
VPQRLSLVDSITVAPALLGDDEHVGILQVTNDFLHSALGYSDFQCHITQAGFPVAREADEDVAVVAEKSPIAHHMPSFCLSGFIGTQTTNDELYFVFNFSAN